MTDFAVWAPLPQRVGVVIDGTRHPMTRDTGGWWRAAISC
ncbi:MAG: hypothetical protein EBU23_18500, partial [Mycobacteriaceae bacterium]|nr:hypothetical protein [Mycobacteriaceae bacterium]